MKIAQFSPFPLSMPGGVNQHVLALSHHLRLLGHDVSIIVPAELTIKRQYPFVERVRRLEVNVYTVGGALTLPVFSTHIPVSVGIPYMGGIDEFLNRMKFDLIHFHNPANPLLSWQFLMQSNTVNIATFHAYVDNDAIKVISKGVLSMSVPLMKMLFKRLSGAIAVSEMAKETACVYYDRPITVIPNGVDIDRFHPKAKPIEEFLHRPMFTILFVGRIEPRKGLPFLLKAVEILQLAGKPVRLVIVGDGNDRAEAEGFVKTHQLQQVWFKGFVSDALLPRYYASCDLFCSPATHNESFGIVLLEAMASKKPILAFDNNGYRFLLKPLIGKEALVPCGNAEALAFRIDQIRDHPEFGKRLAEKGYQASKSFSWDKISKQIAKYYAKIG